MATEIKANKDTQQEQETSIKFEQKEGLKMNQEIKNTTQGSGAFHSIIIAAALSFTVSLICWSLFELFPNWGHTNLIAISEVVYAIWVDFAICVCMSVWGYVCFSEKFAVKASMVARFIVFAIVGYGIIAAWVFLSGWCPLNGFGLFTVICIIAFVFAGAITFIMSRVQDKKLNKQLSAYKDK